MIRPRRVRAASRWAACALAPALVLVVFGTGTAIGFADARPPTGLVTERDFHIRAPRRLAAGTVTLRVENKGPDDHELLVVRRPRRGLPLRRDGLTVDEDAVDRTTVGVLEAGEPGADRRLVVHLRPGRYEFFCNMSGHYLGGMHRIVEVR